MASAVPQLGNPLTDANYREINKALNHLAAGYRLIEMAEQAGQDMSEYRNAYDLAKSRLEGYKSVFFPDRP